MEADGQLFVQEHPKDQIEECWEVALAKILYFGLGDMFWVFLSVKFFVFDMFFWHFSPKVKKPLTRFPRNPRLFDGSKFRLQKVSFDKDEKLLRLQLGLTSYKEPKTDTVTF